MPDLRPTLPILRPALLISAALALAACGRVREELGMSRQSPDEFRVVSRAPLTVPPEFRLPQPTPGARRPQEVPPEALARQALTGTTAAPQPGTTSGEAALLRQAGAGSTDPNIRGVLEQEAADGADTPLLLDQVLGRDTVPDGAVVDPQAERARIEALRQADQPITGDEVPTRDNTGDLISF